MIILTPDRMINVMMTMLVWFIEGVVCAGDND